MKRLAIILLAITTGQISYSQTRGTVTDERDGKTYKTVEIDGSEWMSENLNYQVRGSFCYDDQPENCEKYGRIYTWPHLAVNTKSKYPQGICPDGWHIPSDSEWTKIDNSAKHAKNLAAGGSTGFEILFAGSRFTEGNYGFLNQCASFWTATEDEENNKFAWTRYIYKDKLYKSTERYSTNKMYGQSLRCVKNK